MAKNLVLGLILVHLVQIWTAILFFKNLALQVTRYRGQLSSYTLSEKTNDPNLRKLSDGWTDRQMDRQTDKSDFIGRCPTNVESPKFIEIKNWFKNIGMDLVING